MRQVGLQLAVPPARKARDALQVHLHGSRTPRRPRTVQPVRESLSRRPASAQARARPHAGPRTPFDCWGSGHYGRLRAGRPRPAPLAAAGPRACGRMEKFQTMYVTAATTGCFTILDSLTREGTHRV
jgi:hypothetical protein